MIWMIIAGMTAVAMLIALVPLLRGGGGKSGVTRLAVFERQLDEIAADEAAGVLGPEEARAARLEIDRRILAADKEQQPGAPVATLRGRRILLASTGLVLTAGLLLYLQIGSPGVSDHPFRPPGLAQEASMDGPDFNALLDRLIVHLDEQPDDMDGWRHFRQVAPMLDRQADLAAALARATRARPKNPVLAMLYAESLIILGEGRIGPAAELALDRVEALAPGNPAYRFYEGLALMQKGDVQKARDAWAALLADTPPDAPWRADVERQIAQADRQLGRTPQPSGDAKAAIANLPPAEREAVIRTMVGRLAARLEKEPDDLYGWHRLARSWQVLGESEKAEKAWIRVRDLAQKAGNPDLVAEAKSALESLKATP